MREWAMGIFLTVTLKSSGMQRVFKQNKEMSITGMEWAREECTKWGQRKWEWVLGV